MENYTSKSTPDISTFIKSSSCPKEPVLTMAFVNMQPLAELYSVDDALKNGTLFKNINKPFMGRTMI